VNASGVFRDLDRHPRGTHQHPGLPDPAYAWKEVII
jgi:hypothetical protein